MQHMDSLAAANIRRQANELSASSLNPCLASNSSKRKTNNGMGVNLAGIALLPVLLGEMDE